MEELKAQTQINTRVTRKVLIGSAFFVILVLFIATLSFIFTRTVTKEEFVSRVQSCRSGTYLGQVDGSLVKYQTQNCEVIKEIAHVGEQEPKEIRVLFEGKSMTCKYRKGEFNLENINEFMDGIDSCSGELKDILLELRGYSFSRAGNV